jgi:hypothetical protein
MTTLDAELRKQSAVERTTIRSRFPARHLRLVVFFPPGYEPTDTPQIVAGMPTAKLPMEDEPQMPAETARVTRSFFYDRRRGCAIVNVERALPVFQYVLEWKLPPPPSSQMNQAIRAREQVRGLLGLGNRERERLDSRLETIKNAVCREHLGWGKNKPRTVHLSLSVFDQSRSVTQVACATFVKETNREIELPWGAGLIGWVMRRRRPVFVDTMEQGTAGIYRSNPARPERHVLCVPLPLPSDSKYRTELLLDPSIPCAVASLSCADESGKLERLKEPSGQLLGAVSSELAEKILDVITRESL